MFRQIRKEGRKDKHHTNVKRVVVTRETVDECLLLRCFIWHDPVGGAALWDGFMWRWGCDAAGEARSRDLSCQVEGCSLRWGGEKIVHLVAGERGGKRRWCTYKETCIRRVVGVHEQEFTLDDDTRFCRSQESVSLRATEDTELDNEMTRNCSPGWRQDAF